MSALRATRNNDNYRNSSEDGVADVADVVRGDGQEVPFLPWAEFERHFQWHQGEHVAAIASTQSGKTTAMKAILPRRKFVVTLCTKNKDRVIDALAKDGYVYQREWEPVPLAWPRVILKPGLKSSEDMWRQRQAFKACLDNVFISGGWTLHANEVRYITGDLGLKDEMQLLWLQAASHDSSIVAETQRPAWVPLEMYNASTHIFLWNESDRRNLNRLSELDGANTDLIRWQLPRLRQFESLYVCTRKRAQGLQMARTMAPKGR